jgi:hypothetical protein
MGAELRWIFFDGLWQQNAELFEVRCPQNKKAGPKGPTFVS